MKRYRREHTNHIENKVYTTNLEHNIKTIKKKKIFISWSKKKSQLIAEKIKNLIEDVFENQVEVFFSRDMYVGKGWFEHINHELKKSDLGIIILTNENTKNPWPMFEAGALHTKHLLPLIFGNIKLYEDNPISGLQNATFDNTGLIKLLSSINNSLSLNIPILYFTYFINENFIKLKNSLEFEVNQVLEDYKLDVYELLSSAYQITEFVRNENFDLIIGINHGGALMANTIAVKLKQPIGIIYLDKTNTSAKGKVKHFTLPNNNFNPRKILLVDAKYKEGTSYNTALETVDNFYNLGTGNIKFAVSLYYELKTQPDQNTNKPRRLEKNDILHYSHFFSIDNFEQDDPISEEIQSTI